MKKLKKVKPVPKKVLRQVQAMAVGDRLAVLLNLLKGLDVTKIAQVAALVTSLASATDLKQRIKIALQLAAVVASFTPSTADDALIATANNFLTDAMLDTLVVIVGKLLGPKASSVKAASFKGLNVSATGWNLSKLIALAKLLLPLLTLF